MVRNWRILLANTLTLSALLTYSAKEVLAQITTDGTLASPQTLTGPDYDIPQSLGQTVENNLFHSFGEFNLNGNEAAIFQSGNEINNIFSRVTGGNPSSIDGLIRTLSQDVNLFFLNPNGIIFGPNASLDIGGSFFASTADSFVFDNGLEFSAIDPNTAPLLTVNFTPGLQYGQNNSSGTIANQGNLAAGQNLELSAGNLNLQGQLQAGENLTLQADKIEIRDSQSDPFIATAGDRLSIQGNVSVDIFALNHPQSGLFSAGDMTLSSANPVVGDIHFWSGGNFRIEQLDGSLGNLYSPDDPIIRTNGNVSFDSYTGASLHIFAGGSVNISGDINITSADTVENSVRERITLSDGETVIDIDGGAEPTLDIRAGTTALRRSEIIGSTDGFSNLSNTEEIATSAEINIQNITNKGGLVFLTNQNQPNSDLSGEITVGSIDTSSDLGGGNVLIDSKDSIAVNSLINVSGGDIATFNFTSDGGNIGLFANQDITIFPNTVIASFGLLGGNITFKSKTAISATSSSVENLSIVNTSNSPISTGGNIDFQSMSLSLSDGALIGTFTSGVANTGNVNIQATESIRLTRGGRIEAVTFADGNAGSIFLNSQSLEINDNDPINGRSSGLFSSVGLFGGGGIQGGAGNGGNIIIETDSLRVLNGGRISADIFGTSTEAKAGSIDIKANSVEVIGFNADNNFLSGIFAAVTPVSSGSAGDVTIETETLRLEDGGFISASTFGEGDAGSVAVKAKSVDVIGVAPAPSGQPSRIRSNVDTSQDFAESNGNGGDLTIETETLRVADGGQILANTEGEGKAGNITLEIIDSVTLTGNGSGIFADTEENSSGDGGSILMQNQIPRTLSVEDGATIAVNSQGSGQGGNINLAAAELTLNNGSITAETASNQGGNITLNVEDILQFIDDGEITASAGTARAGGDGGNVTLDSEFIIAFPTSNIYDITANAFEGNGGNIDLETVSFFGSDFVDISASSELGLEGNVSIEILEFDPTRGSIQLPTNVIDASQQISQACTSKEGESDRFVATGRGGLPLNPNEPLRGTAVVTDWVDEPTETNTKKGDRLAQNLLEEKSSPEIIEAQKWIVNDRGNLELVAEPPSNYVLADAVCNDD